MKRENIRRAVAIDEKIYYLEQIQKRVKEILSEKNLYSVSIDIRFGDDVRYCPNDFPNLSSGSKMICGIVETMVENELESLHKEMETL